MLLDKGFEYLNLNCKYRQYKDGTGVLYPVAVRKKRKPEFDIVSNLKKRQKKDRVYKPDRKKIRSASIDLFQNKKGRCLLFVTFTFAGRPDEKKCGQVWEQMLHSLRETYGVKRYVWVKEFQRRGVIHYHLLVDKTYIKIKDLQASYNRICNNAGLMTSKNSVQLGKRPRVYTVQRVKNYLAKYFSKGTDDIERISVFQSRCYGFSEGLTLFRDYCLRFLEQILERNKPVRVISDVYFCIYYFDVIFRLQT